MKGKRTYSEWLGFIILSLFVFHFSLSYASSIEGVGLVTQVENGKDTLLFFKNEIRLRSTRGDVNWFKTDGTPVATNTDEIYPDDGGYYTELAGDISSPVYAFLYTDAGECTLTCVPDCGATTLTLAGDTKPFAYTRSNGSNASYARACTIHYNALAWNTEQWVDSAATMDASLRPGNYILPALYGATPITLCYDGAIRAALGLDSACIETALAPEDVKAVNLQLTSLAVAREDDPQGNNERNRPNSQSIIKATSSGDWSGPLEVAFYANPTPGAKYYRWSIYKASELIVNRFDLDIRYTFSEPGSYRVVCSVNNEFCTSDSMEMVVAISESYLAVPNVFTPNGDGQNDEFRVAYRSIREFQCWVYNRWGKLVYTWTDPSKGWDGNIGGRPAAPGAYFYVIRALGTDAPKNASYIGLKAVYNKKKANADEAVIGVYQLSGDINLLR